jgi:hypothetical protein
MPAPITSIQLRVVVVVLTFRPSRLLEQPLGLSLLARRWLGCVCGLAVTVVEAGALALLLLAALAAVEEQLVVSLKSTFPLPFLVQLKP